MTAFGTTILVNAHRDGPYAKLSKPGVSAAVRSVTHASPLRAICMAVAGVWTADRISAGFPD